MYDYLDMMESWENCAEDWYFDNVVNGIATCSCGEKFKFDEGFQISPNPYSIPVCEKCYEKALDESFSRKGYEDLDI